MKKLNFLRKKGASIEVEAPSYKQINTKTQAEKKLKKNGLGYTLNISHFITPSPFHKPKITTHEKN